MELKTIKQFAEEQHVTYEAIRKQLTRYADDLDGHIVKKNRKQYLDEYAVEFLKEKRRESPLILIKPDDVGMIEELKSQVETLKVQLLSAQNELLKEKDRVIALQDETKKSLEAQVKYTALLEDNKAKDEKLKETEAELSRSRVQVEEGQKTIETLQKERDEAQSEVQSFEKTLFGLYRKRG